MIVNGFFDNVFKFFNFWGWVGFDMSGIIFVFVSFFFGFYLIVF